MLALIQARSNSTRFRNKVLYKIFNKTLLELVINNVKKSRNVKKLIVATSKKKSDEKLVKFMRSRNIKYIRGELDNVAKRLAVSAKKNKAKFFLRINADSPLIDFVLIDKAINIHKKNKSIDLITNVFPRTFPPGQSIEIIKTKILEKNIKYMSKDEKEHVTKYFYKNNSKFKIINFKCPKHYKFKNIKKMTIDYKSDLKKIIKIINDN